MKRRLWLLTGLGVFVMLLGLLVILNNEEAFPKVLGVLAAIAGLVFSCAGWNGLLRNGRVN
jgi:drug/metabolite transporter (DMT)-like permease